MSGNSEWYEIYGDRFCLRCNALIAPKDKGNFCKEHAADILMGVGAVHYPTPEDFIKEAEERGCSKRIGQYMPDDVKAGISRCFLVHNKTKEVFGFFFVRVIEVVVKEGVNLSKELQRRGVKPVQVSVAAAEAERGCGMREHGGGYVVSYSLTKKDMDKVKRDPGLVDKTDIKGPLVVFKDPLVWEDLRYTIRSFLYVDGDKIINRYPPDTWKWHETAEKEPVTFRMKPLTQFVRDDNDE